MSVIADLDCRVAEQLAAGNPEALREVDAHYGPAVQSALKRSFYTSLNDQDIEDALAIALSRLWYHRQAYDRHRASIRDYFYVIARNSAIDIVRTKAKQTAAVRELASTIRRPTSKAHSIQHEKSNELPRQKALLRALNDLGAVDRHILMAAAYAGEGEHWAAELAKELGMPAGSIRVRRMRLMDRLRRQLLSDKSHEKEKKDVTDMPHDLCEVRDEIVRHGEQLNDILSAIHEQGELQRRDTFVEDSPFTFFQRLWNKAVDEESTDSDKQSKTAPGRRKILSTLGSWMKDVEDGNMEFRKAAQSILDRSQGGTMLSLVFQRKGKLSVDQVERSLMGISQAFQRAMPEWIAYERRGSLLIDAGEDNCARWRGDEKDGVCIIQTVDDAISYHGKVQDRRAASALSETIVSDLKAGRLFLPSFTWNEKSSNREFTVYDWVLTARVPKPIAVPSVKYDVAPLPPPSLELELWSKHPELARLVDEAICRAANSEDNQTFDRAQWDNLLQSIHEATEKQYSHAEIAELLLPFVGERVASEDRKRQPIYEQAFDYLMNALA